MLGFERLRRALGTILVLALCVFVEAALAGVPVVTRYRSPKNPDRPVRKATTLIVLHTTEAPAKGSLRHLSERGECHYCVTEDGTIHQIVDRHRVAFHAGTSMWNGRENVDQFSIGIECVGYHDKSMPMAQLKAIRALVKELQGIYKLSDDKVVTHSMVAYSEPNKWHKKKCRGRKRCGMLFAMPSVRRVLDLKTRAAYDPDVKARRLVVGDDTYLPQVLYGRADTMAAVYGAGKTLAAVPAPVPPPPSGAKPAPAPKPVASAKPVAAAKPAAPVRPSSVPHTPADLGRLGFVCLGTVKKNNLPHAIAGKKWNAPDTFYTLRGKLIPGDALDPKRVQEGMGVWRKR